MRTIFACAFRIMVLLIFLGWGYSAVLAQIPRKELSPDQLKQDLQILRQTFERAHAGLYRYTPKEQMDAAFDRVEARLNQPMTTLEFFRLLAPMVDLIHDAHTSIRQSREIRQYAGQKARVFPLDVRYVDGRAFVEKNFSENKAIPLGGEILSINGIAMLAITEKVLTTRSADGFNRTPKYETANAEFWFSYFVMVDDSEAFEIEIKDQKTGKSQVYSTPGVLARVIANGQFEIQSHDAFSLDFIKDGQVALMRITSFGNLALAEQFADAFRKIKEKKIQTLIIDIRENGGGWDELNTELLSYLVPHPFRFYNGFTFRAKDWTDLKYVEYSPDDFLNDPDLKKFSEAERKKMVKERTLPEVLEHNCQTNPAAGIHSPKPNLFAGNLYLLSHGRSGSSAGEIPALLHFLGVGTLIGEEPNAAYQGTCGGVIPRLTLPNSGISTTFPLLAYENAVLPRLFVGRGAPPDFLVRETLGDAIQGRDTALEFTLELIVARRPRSSATK